MSLYICRVSYSQARLIGGVCCCRPGDSDTDGFFSRILKGAAKLSGRQCGRMVRKHPVATTAVAVVAVIGCQVSSVAADKMNSTRLTMPRHAHVNDHDAYCPPLLKLCLQLALKY